MNFPVPLDEEERLRVLDSYGILDTPADAAFDRISSFTARLFDVPICLVSLIDRERQFLKSCFGSDLRETPRDTAFCSHTILEPGKPFIVEDAAKDARFARNPLVIGEPFIRFYAGAPLLVQQASALGSLCIIDHVPRRLDAAQIENLQDLAAMVEDEIRLHERRMRARESEERYRALHETVRDSLERLRENLIWIVPHELKTPLNGVLGFADLLRASWKKIQPSQVDELIAGLQDAGGRMERAVLNICAVTQLDIAAADPLARRRLSTNSPQSINRTAESVARSVAARYQRTDDLTLNLEAGEACMPTDFISKAVEELVDNAFKFSPVGSPVRVSGENSEEDYLLAVEDVGSGMSQQQIDQVGVFAQFDRDRREQQGMGLGLSVVQRIALVFGLTFRIRARRDGGLRASIRFPK